MATDRFSKDQLLNRVLDNHQHIKDELKVCLTKGSIRKEIDENFILDDLSKDKEAIWSFLVLYGLLTFEPVPGEKSKVYDLSSPNIETSIFLICTILRWENRVISSEKAKSGEFSTLSEVLPLFFKPQASSASAAKTSVPEHKSKAPAKTTSVNLRTLGLLAPAKASAAGAEIMDRSPGAAAVSAPRTEGAAAAAAGGASTASTAAAAAASSTGSSVRMSSGPA